MSDLVKGFEVLLVFFNLGPTFTCQNDLKRRNHSNWEREQYSRQPHDDGNVNYRATLPQINKQF